MMMARLVSAEHLRRRPRSHPLRQALRLCEWQRSMQSTLNTVFGFRTVCEQDAANFSCVSCP